MAGGQAASSVTVRTADRLAKPPLPSCWDRPRGGAAALNSKANRSSRVQILSDHIFEFSPGHASLVNYVRFVCVAVLRVAVLRVAVLRVAVLPLRTLRAQTLPKNITVAVPKT